MFFNFHRWKPTRGKWQARASHLPQTHTCTHKHAHLFTNAYPFVCVKARWAVQPRTQSALLRWGTLCIYPAGHPYFPLRGPTELHFHSICMPFFRMSLFFLPLGGSQTNKVLCGLLCLCGRNTQRAMCNTGTQSLKWVILRCSVLVIFSAISYGY